MHDWDCCRDRAGQWGVLFYVETRPLCPTGFENWVVTITVVMIDIIEIRLN